MPHKGGKKKSTPRKAYAQKLRNRETPKPTQQNSRTDTFTLADEARHTANHGSLEGRNLRAAPLQFVMATPLGGTMDEAENEEYINDTQGALTEDTKNDDPVGTEKSIPPFSTTTIKGAREAPASDSFAKPDTVRTQSIKPSDTSSPLNAKPENHSAFFVDVGGEQVAEHLLWQNEPQQTATGTDEDEVDSVASEDDVVIFKGRKGHSSPSFSSATIMNQVKIMEDEIIQRPCDSGVSKVEHTFRGSNIEAATKRSSSASREQPDLETMASFPFIDGGSSSRDAAMADYLDNIQKWDSGIDEILQSASRNGSAYDLSSEVDNSSNVGSDNSFVEKAIAAMTDEEMAHRLAKQEELGLGSSEIILLNEDNIAPVSSADEAEDIADLRRAAENFNVHHRKGRRGRSSKMPSFAEEIYFDGGDDYGTFDIMDFDRVNVSSKHGQGMNMPFVLSDSDLEASMLLAWQNDRKQKKQRKKEREALREQGLLGKHQAVYGQLLHNYPDGMTLEDAINEIRQFLVSDQESLNLVPMDKRDRRIIHEIATKLKLKSQSRGTGMQRHPCLYRTSRTLDSNLALAESILKRFTFDRLHGGRGYQSGKLGRVVGGTGFGRVNGTKYSYRDGETVGASAPALGNENKGHALLSKMGWTSGTALGATNNKGLLEPVAHVVKASRAGLG